MLHAVIMSGGSGTRFWPKSRQSMPKQLLPLVGERSMIRETVDRVRPWIAPEQTWVVTNRAQQAATAEELPEISASRFLIEPVGRNTAPCIGLAALALCAVDPDAVMLVLPADHVIQPHAAFHRAVETAVAAIEANPERMVLFGVRPGYPSVAFGYIERGEPALDVDANVFPVASFREKPNIDIAEQYVHSGRFYWNCGIFVWRAARVLQALKRFEPEIAARLEQLRPAFGTDRWDDVLAAEFPGMKSVPIDVAVMERAATAAGGGQVCVIEAPFEWDDVGAWQSLPRRLGSDEHGNTVHATYCGIETRGCIIDGDQQHLIATYGVEDLIIVQTHDATLIARKDDENALRKLIDRLKEEGHERFL